MKIANINNLSLVAIAMERLINRPDGLPGLGVLYGPSGYGKTTATVVVANSTQAYYVQRPSMPTLAYVVRWPTARRRITCNLGAPGARKPCWKKSALKWAFPPPKPPRPIWI